MRFHSKQAPRGLLKSREKTRLTLLIVSVGIVLVGFNMVRRPEFWSKLFPDTEQAITAKRGSAPQINFKSDDKPLLADEIRIVSDGAESAATTTARRIPFPATQPDADLPDQLTANIRDNVIGVQSSERPAFYSAMKKAWQLKDDDLSKADHGSYALFLDAPSACRGRLFQMEGRLRRVAVVDSSAANQGVNRYYDTWLELPDSGNGLVHIAVLDASPQLTAPFQQDPERRMYEISHEAAPAVSVTGYFFKRESYLSRNVKGDAPTGLSVAPLLVGGTLKYVPPPVATKSRAKEMTPYLGWVTLIVLVTVSMMAWSFAASDAAHSQTRTHQLTRLPATADFENVDSVSVHESLNRLSESGTLLADET